MVHTTLSLQQKTDQPLFICFSVSLAKIFSNKAGCTMNCSIVPWANVLKYSPIFCNSIYCFLQNCNLSSAAKAFSAEGNMILFINKCCIFKLTDQPFPWTLLLIAFCIDCLLIIQISSLLLCKLQEWNVTGWEGASIGLDSLDAAAFFQDDFFDSTRKLCLFSNSKIWQGLSMQDKTDHARSVFLSTQAYSLFEFINQ